MRLARKLNTWFWWLMALLPFAVFLFFCIGRPYSSMTETLSLSAIVEQFASVLPAVSNPVTTALYDILSVMGFDSPSGFLSLFCQYMGYYVIVELLHLAVSVLIFLPEFCHKAFHRLLGNDDA